MPVSPRGLGVIAAAIAGLAGAAILPWHFSDGATPKTPPQSDTDRLAAQATQVAVVDAGTLRLQDRVVRLLGVDPPRRGVTCRSSDGVGVDCGAAATNALAAMVSGVPVACRLRGQDDHGRSFAVCEASGTELNRAVISAGWARADRSAPALKLEEDDARAAHRGLWAAGGGAAP